MKFRGTVARRPVATGSKSEHEAVVLLTADGPLKLRRPGGNPFRDDVLDRLVGHEIEGDGDLYAGQLVLTRWTVVA
jgi:hypothetical protein